VIGNAIAICLGSVKLEKHVTKSTTQNMMNCLKTFIEIPYQEQNLLILLVKIIILVEFWIFPLLVYIF